MEKQFIVIVGRQNNGKSSLINAITGQETAIVSEIPGTTTDPVKKSYEIPDFASVVFIDTAGTDGYGQLGELRIKRTMEAITHANIGILVITDNHFETPEKQLIEKFQALHTPFVIVHNKSDLNSLSPTLKEQLEKSYSVPVIDFSNHKKEDPEHLMNVLKALKQTESKSLLGQLIHRNDIILLVAPIDSAAPNGRLILPQVQTIRDILDNHCVTIVLQPEEISDFLEHTGITPNLVITDSQVFKRVDTLIPHHIPLTSFSIIMAHHKGNFKYYLEGTAQINNLKDNDRILILESCSHHTSCEDIGRVKIPLLLSKTGKTFLFDFVAGLDQLIRPLTDYAMVIQCGGCMITTKQLRNRLQPFIEADIPISNYGMTIAWMHGIFQRAVAPFTGL